jgi:4-amino-4-deoxy-L-arabinose transferase-like glycosyltransferase
VHGSRSAVLAGLVALALVVRLAVIFATPHFVPVTDAAEYDRDAVTLVNAGSFAESDATFHGGPTAYHPPLFPVALAGVYKLVGTGSEHTRWDAGRVLEAVLGAIAVLLTGLIATRLWGARVGLVAAGIAAVDPPLILVGSSLLSESLFIPLVLAAVWAALNYRDTERLRWAAIAGALTGLCALTRGNGVFLIIPIALLLWTGRPRFTRPALAAPALALAAGILMLVPWTIRNLHVFHSLVPITTETGYALEGTYNSAVQNDKRFPALWAAPILQVGQIDRSHPAADEAQISGHLRSMAWRYIRHHPFSVARTVYWNTLRMLDVSPGLERYLAPYEGYPRWLAALAAYAFWPLLALAVLGFFGVRAARRAPWALWTCPFLVYLTAAVFEGTTRYRSPADPFLIMLAALGALAVSDRFAGPAWRTRARDPVSADPLPDRSAALGLRSDLGRSGARR